MLQSTLQWNTQSPVVLVVDDNPAIRDMVSWALELDGYAPEEAAEGQEALDWINNAAHEGRYPAVILLDLSMPGMDGNTFLARLRELRQQTHTGPEPAIVIITSHRGHPDARTLGVERVIVKPFHVRDLLDTVRLLAS